MDASFTIKPNAAVPKFTPRDRSPARPIETELDAAKTVTAAGDGGNEQRERHPDHTPHDVVVDPESREVINRENDVRAHARRARASRTRRCCAIAPISRRGANRITLPPPSPTPTSRLKSSMPSLPLPKGKPLDVPRTVHQALELHHQGRIAEAERLYAAVLAVRPDHIDALQMLGVIKLARGELVTALRLVVGGDAIAAEVAADASEPRPRPQRHEPPRGGAGELRRGAQAQGPLRRGAQQSRRVLVALERNAEALENFKRAIAIKPDYAEAFYNQGNALKELDRYDEALKSYDRAIALRPNYAKPHCNRGSVLDILGRPADALVCYDRALAIQPDFAEAMLNRCGALRALKRIDETLQSLDRLLTRASGLRRGARHARHADGGLQPHRRGAGELRAGGGAQARLQQGALGLVHGGAADPLRRGKRDRGAARRLRAASARASRRLRSRTHPRRSVQGTWHGAAVLPRLPGSERSRAAKPVRRPGRGHHAERYGAAELAPPPAPGEPVRVGIVSGFFYQHSVWKIGVKGWVSQLDPKRFQVSGYYIGAGQDSETALARQLCHRFVQGPPRPNTGGRSSSPTGRTFSSIRTSA